MLTRIPTAFARYAVGTLAIAAAAAAGYWAAPLLHDGGRAAPQGAAEPRALSAEVSEGVRALIASGRYQCCLQNPCTYCFTDPSHQERALVCDCLEEVVNGEAPCGECLGEILEGKGNPLLAEYFAAAISDSLGEAYLPVLREKIEATYGIPAAQQVE